MRGNYIKSTTYYLYIYYFWTIEYQGKSLQSQKIALVQFKIEC
jgi:hypothetical protein